MMERRDYLKWKKWMKGKFRCLYSNKCNPFLHSQIFHLSLHLFHLFWLFCETKDKTLCSRCHEKLNQKTDSLSSIFSQTVSVSYTSWLSLSSSCLSFTEQNFCSSFGEWCSTKVVPLKKSDWIYTQITFLLKLLFLSFFVFFFFFFFPK